MKTSARGRKLIKDFEVFRSKAYRDPVGIWTIGYGFIDGVQEGDTITKEDAERRLIDELEKYERGVMEATGGNVTQSQFDALVSFAFNVGVKGMQGSSVIKAHNRGDYEAAARAFGLWNKAGGKVFPGLVRRRAAEAAMYLEDQPQEMPQAVEPERRMSESTINRGAAAAGATATVAAVTEGARAVADVKHASEDLGAWLVPVLMLAVVALCGYIVWERVKQRKGGWS